MSSALGDKRVAEQNPSHRRLRLMVVDDHDLFRTGLRTLLEEEGYQVIDASSGDVALRLARSFQPEVVVMDMHMPRTSGLEATRMLLAEHPRLSVLMLTVAAHDDSVLDAIRAGAAGYLLKDAELPELVAAVEAAAVGHATISPGVAPALLRWVRRAPTPTSPVTSEVSLSERERAVLGLVAQGYENAAIAGRLYVSVSTARNLVSRVLEKLGVKNRVQAATYAIRHDLVDIPVASERDPHPQLSHGSA
jgi:DNA-binding NarL/FixJ family response regulator